MRLGAMYRQQVLSRGLELVSPDRGRKLVSTCSALSAACRWRLSLAFLLFPAMFSPPLLFSGLAFAICTTPDVRVSSTLAFLALTRFLAALPSLEAVALSTIGVSGKERQNPRGAKTNVPLAIVRVRWEVHRPRAGG